MLHSLTVTIAAFEGLFRPYGTGCGIVLNRVPIAVSAALFPSPLLNGNSKSSWSVPLLHYSLFRKCDPSINQC